MESYWHKGSMVDAIDPDIKHNPTNEVALYTMCEHEDVLRDSDPSNMYWHCLKCGRVKHIEAS